MKDELVSQYTIALRTLKGVIEETDEATLNNASDFGNAAWHIAYHAIYYANIYSSPTEDAIRSWPKERENYRILGRTPWPPHERLVPSEPYSKSELIEFADFVLGNIPAYLESMEPEAPCWPHWYEQSQFEFHLNNLRHIQHHTAQLIERNRGSKVGWMVVK